MWAQEDRGSEGQATSLGESVSSASGEPWAQGRLLFGDSGISRVSGCTPPSCNGSIQEPLLRTPWRPWLPSLGCCPLWGVWGVARMQSPPWGPGMASPTTGRQGPEAPRVPSPAGPMEPSSWRVNPESEGVTEGTSGMVTVGLVRARGEPYCAWEKDSEGSDEGWLWGKMLTVTAAENQADKWCEGCAILKSFSIYALTEAYFSLTYKSFNTLEISMIPCGSLKRARLHTKWNKTTKDRDPFLGESEAGNLSTHL